MRFHSPVDTFLGRGRFLRIGDAFQRNVDTIRKQIREKFYSADKCVFLFPYGSQWQYNIPGIVVRETDCHVALLLAMTWRI